MAEKAMKVESIKMNNPNTKIKVTHSDKKITIKNKADFLDRKYPNYVSLLGVLGILFLWQIVSKSGLVNEFTLPAPTTVLMTASELISTGTLWPEITASLYRIGMGYAIGLFSGLLLALF